VVHCPGILDARLASHGPDRGEDELICQGDMTINTVN
jgi:hypothetical protein